MTHAARKPWHERFPLLGRPRAGLRAALFGFLRRLAGTPDARDILSATQADCYARPAPGLDAVASLPAPYDDLGVADEPVTGEEAVFITGRFRSGSTLLWNLFRHLDGFTAYYEPLNERRWFDPAARGDRVDRTHRKVEEYWREYDGMEDLGSVFDDSWPLHRLFLDERAWAPRLKHYVAELIRRAKGRAALQFNRVDFRLPWLRHHFPAARLVHLYRHPRDQWCSTFLDGPAYPPDGGADFAGFDRFYLRAWVADLKHHFPFLEGPTAPHPYRQFYYLWKLSYLFGRAHAHHSVCFEELVADPVRQLEALFEATGVEGYDLDRLTGLMVKPALGKWKDYAADTWFRGHESACEAVLADFLGPAARPGLPLARSCAS
jgi:hypothetical protein